jgi:exo-beta-1,3-glucanase (GH17 family)
MSTQLTQNRNRLRMPAAGLLLEACFTLLWLFWQAWPQAVPRFDPKLPCVSYAPFYGTEQTPMNPAQVVSAKQITQDLQRIKRISSCVRTYGVDHGLDQVPGIAHQLGMQVHLGAWIGRNAQDNQAQLQRAIMLAKQWPEAVKTLVIGNEVLLRGDLPPQALQALLEQAQQSVTVPVAYAEVWEFWLRHADLADQVDVIAVHILPFWEDTPVGIHEAVSHVQNTLQKMQTRFAGKQVWVAETGWPSVGRQRGPALPGQVNQTRFVAGLLAASPGVADFNFIEAFDQPWKKQFEGAMGAGWGLWNSHGEFKLATQGSQANWPGAGLLLALLASGLALAWVRRAGMAVCPPDHWYRIAGLLLMFVWVAASIRYWLAFASTDIAQWVGVLAIGSIALLPWHYLNAQQVKPRTIVLAVLTPLAIGLGLLMYLLIAPRYRGLPVELFGLMGSLACLLTLVPCAISLNRFLRWAFCVLWVLVLVSILYVLWVEGRHNTQAMLLGGAVGFYLLVLMGWFDSVQTSARMRSAQVTSKAH